MAFRRLGVEHHANRVAAGLSLRDCAAASGTSRTKLWKFEHGLLVQVDPAELGAWLAVVGLDLALRAYPAGDPIRDRGQLALLGRLRSELHPSLRWRTEVPLPILNDLRAWDAEISGRDPRPWRVTVEAETRIADGQALERKLALKIRDDPGSHVVLLVADTTFNKRALAAIGPGLRAAFPLGARSLLAALRAGREPGGSGILLM